MTKAVVIKYKTVWIWGKDANCIGCGCAVVGQQGNTIALMDNGRPDINNDGW